MNWAAKGTALAGSYGAMPSFSKNAFRAWVRAHSKSGIVSFLTGL